MRILITGATGRVGSRLAPRALQSGHQVRLLVRQPERVERLRQRGAEVIPGDLSQPEMLAAAVAGVDAIIHLAAFFRGATEEQAQAVNFAGALALARAAIQAGVSRFVFTSTNLVYGPGRGRPARESDEPQPLMAYPQSKVAAEQALRELHHSDGLGLRIARLAFVYGEDDPHLGELPRLVSSWHPAKRLHMAHHADVGHALLLLASAPGIDGRIYNVADDAPLTIAEIGEHLGLPDWERPDASARPLDDPWEGVVSNLRLRDELGWRPIYPSFYTARDAGAL